MLRLPQLWAGEWLPEVKQHLGFWEANDVTALPMPELVVYLTETIERTKRMWELHFRAVLPALLALNTFDEFSRELFGASDPLDAFRLLRGFASATTRADEELWQLSRMAERWQHCAEVFDRQRAAARPHPRHRRGAFEVQYREAG